jgi:hypothetical protein
MARFMRWWHRWRELFTIGGYFVMLGSMLSALWIGFCFIEQANANTMAVTELQAWKEMTEVALARMEQKIDDIHESVVEK